MNSGMSGGNPGVCGFEISSFAGFERRVLELRNTNRDNPESLPYLEWRYTQTSEAPPPRIFWLLSPGGDRIGMAAAIFRRYAIDGKLGIVAVIGDISVDAAWRGRALGAFLLGVMTRDLLANFPGMPALVIPTDSARRALVRSGWIKGGRLHSWVHVLDGTRYIRPYVGERAARTLANCARAASSWWTRRRIPEGARLEILTGAAAALAGLAPTPTLPGRVMRVASEEQWRWRYETHPRVTFRFARLSFGNAPRAVLVFEQESTPRSATVYDLHAPDDADARVLLAAFLLWGHQQRSLESVRFVIDGRHPLRKPLRALGFVRRKSDAVFQLRAADPRLTRLDWHLTQGDKDT